MDKSLYKVEELKMWMGKEFFYEADISILPYL